VATLRKALSDLDDPHRDFSAHIDADLGFHLLLCQLSENSVLVDAWRHLEGLPPTPGDPRQARYRARDLRESAVLPRQAAGGVRPSDRRAGRRRAEPPAGWVVSRIVIEKPYGHDERSAQALGDRVHAAFEESQVFRIDHYLGKYTIQNVLALRFATAIFEPI
jgi:hypothetical protein